MKKKALFTAFVGVLACLLLILSCASSGGGGGSGGGAPVLGTFVFTANNDSNDGGTSTITMEEAEEVINGETVKTYRFYGEVTDKIQYGVVDATLTPDEATLELIKTAKAISFMFIGDGRTYNIEAPITSVTDWGFHRFGIKNDYTPGQPTNIFADMRFFMQPGWASQIRFRKDQLTSFRIQTVNAAEGGVGPFDFKIWNVMIHQ
jgi:hypothetical protein